MTKSSTTDANTYDDGSILNDGTSLKSHEKIIVLTTARKILEDYINTMGFKDPDDYLFRPSSKNKPLGVFSYGLNLRKARKKAGITKKIHAHLFRHTRATRLARMNISAIEAMQSMGWLSMHMWQHYSHAQPEDTANKIAAIENGGEFKIMQTVQTKYKVCPRCKEDKLPESYLICPRCGMTLNERVAIQNANVQQELDKLLQNPQVISFLQALADPIKREKALRAMQGI